MEDHQGQAEREDFDAFGAILVFVGIACVFIAACSATGFCITFRP